MSYVRFARSRSYSPMMTSSKGPICSSQNGCTQPPCPKPPDRSSSGPPGACMTPSIETKTAPVSLRIDLLATEGGFDLGDVDLLHRHHRLERALGGGFVGARGRFEQHARRDLPREAPLVLAPAAFAFLASVLDDGIP